MSSPDSSSASTPAAKANNLAWGAIIVQLGTALISAVTVYMIHRLDVNQAIRMHQASSEVRQVREVLATNTEDAAEKAIDVKRALQVTTTNQDRKLDSIHQLVNSAMGSQLKVNAIALRRLANVTGTAEDLEAATIAEKASHEHEAKQRAIDRVKMKEPRGN